jgi:hypothetical protein
MFYFGRTARLYAACSSSGALVLTCRLYVSEKAFLAYIPCSQGKEQEQSQGDIILSVCFVDCQDPAHINLYYSYA